MSVFHLSGPRATPKQRTNRALMVLKTQGPLTRGQLRAAGAGNELVGELLTNRWAANAGAGALRLSKRGERELEERMRAHAGVRT